MDYFSFVVMIFYKTVISNCQHIHILYLNRDLLNIKRKTINLILL